ncbi:MAG: DnaD domain protein [Oscillospiraceae bacterium]
MPAPKPAPAEELPEYETEDLVRRSREDAGFSASVTEAQKVLGHVLSSSVLKRLFGIYDYLALPPEVILMLSDPLRELLQGRRPSMRFIEKEAYVWANREIMGLGQAEE